MLASSGLDCDYKRIAVERIVPRARLKDISIGNVELSKLEGLYMKKLIAILLISALLIASALADVGDTLPNHIVMRGMAASMDLDGDGTEEALRWDVVDIDEYTSSLALTVVDAEGTQINYST